MVEKAKNESGSENIDDVKAALIKIHDVTGGWTISDFRYEKARHFITIEEGYVCVGIDWQEDGIEREERYDVFPSGYVFVKLKGVPAGTNLRTGVEIGETPVSGATNEFPLKDRNQIIKLADYLQRVKKEGFLSGRYDSVKAYLD